MDKKIFYDYFSTENTYEKKEIDLFFGCPCERITEEEFKVVYYELGKDFSGILNGWKRYIEDKYRDKSFIIMERDAGILKKMGMKAKSMWLNYDMIDNESEKNICQYIRQCVDVNSVLIDVGIVGNVINDINVAVSSQMPTCFLLSANKFIDGYLNQFISFEYNFDFMISIVRSLENVFKSEIKPKYIKEIKDIKQRELNILKISSDLFLQGVKDGNRDVLDSLRQLRKRQLASAQDGKVFSGIINEKYTISDTEKVRIEEKFNKYY